MTVETLKYFAKDGAYMKSCIILILIFIFIFPSGGLGMDSEQNNKQIRDLYHDMYSAMIRKDSAKLAEILDASFVLVHMTGMKQDKQEYINAITAGVLNYYSEHTENISITLHGDNAELTGQSRVEAAVFGGGRHTWRLQLDIMLALRDDRWVMTGARASAY